jgi:hypothetical protein
MTGRRRFLGVVVVQMLLLAMLAADADGQDARRPKKLIATGWDQPDSQRLPDLVAEIDKRPFDGVVVQAVATNDKKQPISLGSAFSNQAWKRAWFQPAVDRLKGCKFQRPMDNFLILNANPGDVDWFDDAGWGNIVEHWRIAAWVAKQSGFKGILFDPEPYAPPHSQFHYSAQPQRDRHTFDEYCTKARQRGREVMQAVATEYPDVTIFCFFMNSIDAAATGQPDPRRALQSQGYGLLPALVDGWLDAAPPGVTLVDGCESAYLFNSRQQFLEAGMQIKGPCQELVSPENRGKYRARVQTSFGIYLDAYVNAKASPWYIDGLGGPRVERLRANVQNALYVADEYVWVYGEKNRWWTVPGNRVRKETWPEALPGCEQALRFARDPADFARVEIGRLKEAGKLVNLARNGDFSSDRAKSLDGVEEKYAEGRPSAGWGSWQESKSKGQFTWDRQVDCGIGADGGAGSVAKGSARAAGVAGGCFIQAYRVKPGERYCVAALRRIQGRGDAGIRVRWQTADGRWAAEHSDKLIYAKEPSQAASSEWSKLSGVVEVPEGVGRLVILLGVSGQASPQDVAWYDNVELYRLP